MKWLEEDAFQSENKHEVLSFEEYIQQLESGPQEFCRTSAQYLKDMFDFYGRSPSGGFNIFLKEHPDAHPVFGQESVQKSIYQNLLNFVEEGRNNKLLLLVGPNGSSKSSLVKKIMRGCEDFSHSQEGALYTFSWIFPIDSFVKGNLGLQGGSSGEHLNTYAHLEDKEITAILTSELRDHPLLLIPKEKRQEYLQDLFKEDQSFLENIQKSFLFQGDLSKKNKMIYEALLKNYKGNHKEVLKHIKVERFYISRRFSTSAVTIEPQMHVDASMQQITMDKRLNSLPPSLQSLNLFSMQGEIVQANRGILEFSDLLKRPLDAFKYLLTTMETQNINLRGILTELDIFFIGSSNEIHLVAFRQHPDFNSFKGRLHFIRVPYLLNYREEERIYQEQIETLKHNSRFEPGSLALLSKFAMLTRIRPAQEKNYQNKKLGKVVTSLTPIEKCQLLSEGLAPSRLKSDEKQLLKQNIEAVQNEYNNDNLYEGKFGISPRRLKEIIYELSWENNLVTFVEVIEYLKKFIEKKNENDFLNIPPQGDYNNPQRFIETLKQNALDQFDIQVRNSLDLVDDRSYEDYLSKYIQNINALIKKEKIKNEITGKSEDADMYFIQEFEKNIKIKETPESFRSHMLSNLGAYSLDNPGRKIKYTEVFPEMEESLRSSFVEEQRTHLAKMASNLVHFIKDFERQESGAQENISGLSQENKRQIERLLETLISRYDYSKKGAISLLEFLIKERY